MFFTRGGVELILRTDEGVERVDFGTGRKRRIEAPSGHQIIAVDVRSDHLGTITSDGSTLWAWERGLGRGAVDLGAAPFGVRVVGSEFVARLASRSIGPIDRALFLDRQDGSRAALPTVIFGIGSTTLVACQLDYFDGGYRAIAVSPPGEQSTESRLVAWSTSHLDTPNVMSVVAMTRGEVTLGEPSAIEAAFDAAWPLRHAIEMRADSLVHAAVREDVGAGWTVALARRDEVRILQSTAKKSELVRVETLAPGERLVGLGPGVSIVVRSADEVTVRGDRARSWRMPSILEAACSPRGERIAVRTSMGVELLTV